MSNLAFAARHSSDSPEWYTPAPIVEAARAVMGGIDLDPASHEEANRTIGATRFYSERENGLVQPWFGRVFLNPPGGLVNEFWRELMRRVFCGDVVEAVWIGYSLEQLQTLQKAGATHDPMDWPICIPAKRIAFVENEARRAERIAKLVAQGKNPNTRSSPSHSNYITYIGPKTLRFKEIFSRFGKVRL